MFCTDPVAAFTNLSRAVRPGARLVLLVWQDYDRNEWAVVIRRSIAARATRQGVLFDSRAWIITAHRP